MSDRPSMFERIKIGAKGFMSHALGYFPRGIALTGLIFAGSAILESMTAGLASGPIGLGVAKWGNGKSFNRTIAHLGFGSIIAGVIGAGSYVHCACKTPSGLAAPAVGGPSNTIAAKGHEIAKTVTESCMTAATEHFVG